MIVASTPREFPLITASSLSSKTWRPMPKAYVARGDESETMTQYAAFLRGVNVGGVNLKMAEVATR